ncbi:uncharacterized protein BCR38DRAFT_329372 [Pseudomassariella vexata]|uniref:Corticosteroid-binding protein n=1 Tax=Pseudomassariella vexata TaxID=1141098 RepID=A0A1Y2EIN3_9PEZI|nr:uncharacterized protein BCR38DRAFT_329372 [Pseudomassariella vexata]ORY71442.1 hypothetical protein BCR38DRAFT_329372 [Pseudomassariella vexata]
MDPIHRPNYRPLIQRLALPWLLVVPGLLAVVTIAILVIHTDLNIVALYSQCHARSRLSGLSHIPVLGAPACFLVSFFQYANTSVRAIARMSVILSFVGALLTISLVESARICNKSSRVISKPTLPWLVSNLVGGVLVWDLVIVSSYLSQAKNVQAARESASAEDAREADPEIDKGVRGLSSQVEAMAIPIAVVVGFIVPSVVMLVLTHPITIGVWLFFPIWVSTVRYAVKFVAMKVVTDPGPYHLESHRVPLVTMYAVPVICSVLSHGFLIWNMFAWDDRKEMTRATIKFIEIDVAIIAVTILYWLLVEAGVVACVTMIAISILMGPGAGLAVAWFLREKAFDVYYQGTQGSSDREGDVEDESEETPLLR